VLGGLVKNAQFQRPDDYYTRLAIRYPTLTAADLDKAARAAIDPAKLTWVVVGDAAKVKPQLETSASRSKSRPLRASRWPTHTNSAEFSFLS
jgi:predicted Zn-dependent peptidase